MAFQIMPEGKVIPRKTGWAEALGEGVDQLVEHKFGKMKQREKEEKDADFYEKLGLPRDAARSLAAQEEWKQKEFLHNSQGLGFQQEGSQDQYGALSDGQSGGQRGGSGRIPFGKQAPENPEDTALRTERFQQRKLDLDARRKEDEEIKQVYESAKKNRKKLEEAYKVVAHGGNTSANALTYRGLGTKSIGEGEIDQIYSQLVANKYGDKVTPEQDKLARLEFPNSRDSKDLQKKKLTNLLREAKDQEKLLSTRSQLVKANGGQAPEGLDQVLGEIAQNQAQRQQEEQQALVQESQQGEDGGITAEDEQAFGEAKDDTYAAAAGRIVAGGVAKAAALPYHLVTSPIVLGDALYRNANNARHNYIEKNLERGGDALYGTDPEVARKNLEESKEKNPDEPNFAAKGVEYTNKYIQDKLDDIGVGEYLKPKNEWESDMQEIVASISTLPFIGGQLKDVPKLVKNLVIGKTAKKLTEGAVDLAGGSENVGKVGGIVADIVVPALWNSFNSKHVKEQIKPTLQKDIKELENIAGNTKVNVENVEKSLQEVRKAIDVHPQNREYRELLSRIEEKVFDGEIPLADMQNFDHNIGQAINGPKGLTGLQPVRDAIREAIINVEVPGYQDLLDKTNQNYVALHDIQDTQSFMKKMTSIRGVGLNPTLGLGIKTANAVLDNDGIQAGKALAKIFENNPTKVTNYLTDMFTAASKHRQSDYLNSALKLGRLIEGGKKDERVEHLNKEIAAIKKKHGR